jgi:hypothetical protein
MNMLSTIRWTGLAVLACMVVACAGPAKTVPGPDNNTGSDASIVPWSDGKSAIAISCKTPGGCQQRAQAMCPGGYETLKSENMPVGGGNALFLPDNTAATIRCR